MRATTPSWCTVLSSPVYQEQRVRNVLAPAPHPEPASRPTSKTRVNSFLGNALRW